MFFEQPMDIFLRAIFRKVFLLGGCSLAFVQAFDLRAAEASEPHPSAEAQTALAAMAIQPGLKAELFASEPLFANPVAFSFDDFGRCYLVETHRRRTSVFDIRRFGDWLDDDFSFRTVDDRRQFLARHVLADNPSIAARYQIDRNGDGTFDINDLEVESERIRRLVDSDGDGVADLATTFADGFNSSVSGVAAGVLAYGDSVWFTCIPDLWHLKDRNQDGRADERRALHSGFGVHMAFGGHDFHGVIMGPDGRLYFSIADRGSHVEKDGKVLAALPDTGAVFRCQPDGSEFEVVATGLRNPQELAFDDFGNLWTVDNNGDGGDQARLVSLVEGGDSGWRIGWQWLPDMGAWKEEKLWEVASENTAAYLLPPLAYVGHGPAGLAYYPGTGLSSKFKKHFFLADFPGGVRSFTVRPKGASFEVEQDREYLQNNSREAMDGKLIWGLSPVDVGFSPAGGLYVADWIQGWEKTGKGRMIRLFDETVLASEEVSEVKSILANGLSELSVKELADLLAHADQRVRQRAQFELADRYEPSKTAVGEVITGALGLNPLSMLKRVLEESEHQLARVHAIWGIGQVLARHRDASSLLIPFLVDEDPEIRAQVAKTLADRAVVGFYSDYAALLTDSSPRVQFYGALWLGKTVKRGYHEVQASSSSGQLVNLRDSTPIFELLRRNRDTDLYLRHAAVMALTWMSDLSGLSEVASDPSPSVRLGAVLALRRLKRPEVAIFLKDQNPQILLETARAIYDENIEEALPQLAELIQQPNLAGPVLRRSLNALLRLGKTENAAFLVAFAENDSVAENLRIEALEALSVWGDPPKRDRVLGLWRPLADRDSRSAIVPLRLALATLFSDPSDAVQAAAIKAMTRLGMATERERLFELLSNAQSGASVQSAAFDALAQMGGDSLLKLVRLARDSAFEEVRRLASQWQSKLPADDAVQLYRLDLEQGAIALQRAALRGLAELEDLRAGRMLESWLDKLLSGNLPNELTLDVLEAASASSYGTLEAKLQTYESQRAKDDRFALFRETLYGGDSEKGRKVFEERQDLACARCHKLGEIGGDVGPNLAGIGLRLSREKLLQSILFPNDDISPGYESISVELKEGGFYAGVVTDENDTQLILHSLEDGEMKLAKSDIASRSSGLSAMPEQIMTMLSKQDLRDLIEFLARQN